jgi:hypothetical protein
MMIRTAMTQTGERERIVTEQQHTPREREKDHSLYVSTMSPTFSSSISLSSQLLATSTHSIALIISSH